MDLEAVRREINRVRDLIDGEEEQLGALKQHLQIYWDAKGEVDHAVRRTHNKRRDGAIIFRPEGAAARVPLFIQLDALNREWAPVKGDYRIVKSRLAGYDRDLRRLKNELKYLKRKEGQL